jgi:peptide/nickel transport system ATP-binding protein
MKLSNILVEAKGLKKYFKVSSGYLHALDDVTITIKKGQTIGIVGESGCGKSTLGRTILRLYEPTAGSVLFEGEDIMSYKKSQMKKVRPKMQLIFQDPYSSLNPRMTVEEIIAEPMLINKFLNSKREIMNRVDKLMDIVGLAERLVTAYPHELDGGRRQRIGIARALALDPKFIVCDEPVSSLDVSIQAQIINLLMDLQKDMGLTYMFITHDLSVVKYISNEIVVMYLGKCVEQAQPNDLFKNPLHPYTKALLSAIPVPNLSMRNKQINIIKGEVTSPVNPKAGCRFANRCPIVKDECEVEPILREVSDGHFVACHFAE